MATGTLQIGEAYGLAAAVTQGSPIRWGWQSVLTLKRVPYVTTMRLTGQHAEDNHIAFIYQPCPGSPQPPNRGNAALGPGVW